MKYNTIFEDGGILPDGYSLEAYNFGDFLTKINVEKLSQSVNEVLQKFKSNPKLLAVRMDNWLATVSYYKIIKDKQAKDEFDILDALVTLTYLSATYNGELKEKVISVLKEYLKIKSNMSEAILNQEEVEAIKDLLPNLVYDELLRYATGKEPVVEQPIVEEVVKEEKKKTYEDYEKIIKGYNIKLKSAKTQEEKDLIAKKIKGYEIKVKSLKSKMEQGGDVIVAENTVGDPKENTDPKIELSFLAEDPKKEHGGVISSVKLRNITSGKVAEWDLSEVIDIINEKSKEGVVYDEHNWIDGFGHISDNYSLLDEQGNALNNFEKPAKEGISNNNYTDFYLVVNLDERGDYSATVYNPNDEVVYEILSAEQVAEMQQDGFLKYKPDEDLKRLAQYLAEMNVIPNGSTIYSEVDYEKHKLYSLGGETNAKVIYQHKHIPSMTLEFLENTNKGIKGIQRDKNSLSKKERTSGKIAFYSASEMKDLWQKKEEFCEGGSVNTPYSPEEVERVGEKVGEQISAV